MAKITAALVKQLREMTDSPMMECKKALVEADGDIDAAVDVLRKMGVAKAVKKAGRDTNEGTIGAFVAADTFSGALVELKCETDFVGTNAKFTGFAKELAQVVAEKAPADAEALLADELNGAAVKDAVTEMIHVMGENMKVGRIVRRATEAGSVESYVHLGGKIGVLAEFSCKPESAANETFRTFAHDVCLQIAASAPISARREDVPASVVEHEKEIYKAQAADSGKPEAIQEKIAVGRLEKFYKQSVLTEQVFVKDSDITIAQLAKKVSKELGDDIQIVGFDRLVLGDDEA